MKNNEIKLSSTLDFTDDFPPQSFEEWKEKVIADLKGKPFEKLVTRIYEGVDLQPIYVYEKTKEKLAALPYPSFENFMRGEKASGNFTGWNIAQTIYAETADEFNRALKTDVEMGLNSVNLKLRDSLLSKTFDDFFALEINNVDDLNRLLDGVNIERFPFYVFSSFPNENFLSIFKEYLNSQNIDVKNIRGGIEIDPVNESIAAGLSPQNSDEFWDEIFTHVNSVNEIAPNYFSVNIKANNYANAGGGAVCELAYALASAVEYLSASDRKFPLEKLAGKIRFTFALTPFFFTDIAKLRAFKPLWRKVLREFGIDNFAVNILAESSVFYRTVAEPYANMLRATAESFGAIIGGANAINIIPFNTAYEKPDDFSRRMARNAQIILQDESALNRVIDSGGGSYYLETLTEEFAEKAWKLFQTIEAEGGMLSAAKKGIAQKRINEVRQKKFDDFAKRKLIAVGINAYVKRDDKIADELLPGNNAYALASKFNLTKSYDPLDFTRLSTSFENLRKKVLASEPPKIELVALGKLSSYKARADFSRALFETAGFEVVYPEKGNTTTDDAVRQILNSRNKIFTLCSDDETYSEFIPTIAKRISEEVPEKKLILAGKPKNDFATYEQSGVSSFIYAGMNALEFLSDLFEEAEKTK